MKLEEILEKMRRADKLAVEENGFTVFDGNVNECSFQKNLLEREVDEFYPEMFGKLLVILK